MKDIDLQNYGCDEEDMNKEDNLLAAQFLNNLRLNSPSATTPSNITESEIDSAQDGSGWDDLSDTDGFITNGTTESFDEPTNPVTTANTPKLFGKLRAAVSKRGGHTAAASTYRSAYIELNSHSNSPFVVFQS